jgi:uncharacterized membrane protein YeaQ/YmgE (transglycosylase-associated protein family)
MLLDPAVTFLLVLAIGIIAGIVFDRIAGPGWLTRQLAGSTRGIVTSALVGIAGSFIGFHLASLLSLGSGWLALLLGAAIGAVVVLWCWRMVK